MLPARTGTSALPQNERRNAGPTGAHNKLTELGEWNEAMLRDKIAGLLAEDFDLSLLGITDKDLDALIRSKNGFWLAIPTAAAGKSSKGGRITPGEWERRAGLRQRFIYRRRGPSLLVAEGRLNTKGRAVTSKSKTGRGVATMPIFLLVPQVKLRKRLDLARDAERAVDSVPGLIVANWVEGRR